MGRAPNREDRIVIRRDADGNERVARDWESLTERLIREAQEGGHFDDLPGLGQPLALDDDAYAGEMAAANRLLRNAGAAPPWIDTDKRVRALVAEVDQLLERAHRSGLIAARRLRRQLDALLDEHDAAIAHLEIVAPSARQHRRRLDREEAHARLAAALSYAGERP